MTIPSTRLSNRCILVVILLALSLPALASSLQDRLQALDFELPRERLPAPAFSLPTLNGGRLQLDDYRGQPVLLHFWATFCTSCREEMPVLAALAERFGKHGLAVLAVDVDRGSRRQVERFMEDLGVQLDVPLDPDGQVRRSYEIDTLPTTYLIGRDGRFLARSIGPRDWGNAAVGELFEQLTAVR